MPKFADKQAAKPLVFMLKAPARVRQSEPVIGKMANFEAREPAKI